MGRECDRFGVELSNYKKGVSLVLTDYSRAWDHTSPEQVIEYGPLDIIWKLVRYSGADISRSVFFALSGFPTFFFYNRDKFWVFDALRDRVIQRGLAITGFEMESFEPESLEDAIAFMDKYIGLAIPIYASWFEPILIYGLEGHVEHPAINWYNPVFAPEGLTWGLDELQNNWWNWSDNPAAKKLTVVRKKKDFQLSKELYLTTLRDFVNGMEGLDKVDEDGTFSGVKAIEAYSADLKDPEVDFTLVDQEKGLNRVAWIDFAIYSQWTQLIAMRNFIDTGLELVDGDEDLDASSEFLMQAIYHWSEWEEKIGRLSDEDLFMRRIANMQIRFHAASSVDRSIDALKMALDSINKYFAKTKEV